MQIDTSIDIIAKPKKVFPWIANPDKARRWQKNVKESKIIKKAKEIVGTTFKETMQENGKTLEMYGEVMGYEQNRSISFRLESKIHKVDVEYFVESKEDKSIVSMKASINWMFPMNIVSLFVGKRMRKGILDQSNLELRELKKLCEENLNLGALESSFI